MTKRYHMPLLFAVVAILVSTIGCPPPKSEPLPQPSPSTTTPPDATPDTPATEEPAADMPVADAPKADAPKADAPKTATPKADAPKADAPKADAPKADAPKADAPKTDAPKTDAPKTDAPKTDAPKTDAPKADAPKADAPKADAPKTDAPKTDAPKTDAPKTDAPKADAPKADAPKADAPKADAPKADAPKADAPKTATPKADAPKTDAPKTDAPKTDAPKADAPKADAPKADAPKTDTPKTDMPKADAPKTDETAQVGKSQLLLKLPAGCNTPDGMCLLKDGSVILSMPNFNELAEGARLIKITPDNKAETFLELGKNPDTGDLIGPMGVCLAPSGDLFLADFQMNGNKQSRVLRIPMKDGKPGEPVPAIDGFHVSNAVICHGGYLYVSETQIDVKAQPGTSGVLRFKLEDIDKGVIKLADDVTKDPHFLGVIEIHNTEVRFAADGLCLDKAGNLYCGNFADGTLHRFEFDEAGKVKSNTIFARADFMKCCDGIFYNPKTDEVYTTDSVTNAIHAVAMDGTVRTLARNGDTDGLDGGMDQPCEVLLRGNELIVSNMDWPIPGCVNKQYNKPCTLSVILIEN